MSFLMKEMGLLGKHSFNLISQKSITTSSIIFPRFFSSSNKQLRSTPTSIRSKSNLPIINQLNAFSSTSLLSNRSFSINSLGTKLRLPILRKNATAAPEDVQQQVNLFKELSGAEEADNLELIGRWEELTQFWSGRTEVHPLTRSDEAFVYYLKALAALGASSSDPAPFFAKLADAPTKRQTLLNSTVSTSTTPTASTIDASTNTTPLLNATSASPTSSTVTPPTSILSPSALVTAIFSGAAGRGKGGEAKVVSQGSYGAAGGWGSFAGMSSTGPASAGTLGAAPIRVIVEEAKSAWPFRALKFVLVTLLYSFLLLSLLSLLLDSSGILRAQQQTTPFTPTAAPDAGSDGARGTSFKDVHGVEEAKLELVEIVEFLKDPTKFEKLGGRLPRGVLLTGPPGTGKTLLARAVAGEAGVAFFSASGSEFDEMYVGVGARRIRELFAAARKASPAIIFIDELDAIGGKRSPKDQHYVKQTLNQLLVELDGFSPGEGVILIGATNFPESLDKALIRPGRFDRHVVVPLPDWRGRAAILTHHMRSVAYDKLVDISIIARGTIGFSGADLQSLVNQAAVKASTENAGAVRASHFEWAKERIMMGAARKSAYITESEKLATAYHEGGHALVALYTPGAYPLQSVTVVPRGMALGYTLMLPEMDKNSHSLSEYRAKLDVAMGGRVAEELIYGRDNVTDGASSDISSATNMATNMVCRFGFSDVVGPVSHMGNSDAPISPQTQAAIETEIRGLIEAAQIRAKDLLTSKSIELERLARALVEHETLNLSEVKKVIRGEKITKNLET